VAAAGAVARGAVGFGAAGFVAAARAGALDRGGFGAAWAGAVLAGLTSSTSIDAAAGRGTSVSGAALRAVTAVPPNAVSEGIGSAASWPSSSPSGGGSTAAVADACSADSRDPNQLPA
jgi:hypothetical protein